METRTDDAGRWESQDGRGWVLVEPSNEFIAAREAAEDAPVEPGPPSPEERITALEDEVRGMRDRVASVEAISDEVKAMRDAIAPGRKD